MLKLTSVYHTPLKSLLSLGCFGDDGITFCDIFVRVKLTPNDFLKEINKGDSLKGKKYICLNLLCTLHPYEQYFYNYRNEVIR